MERLDADTLKDQMESVQDIDRVEFALQSENPGIRAAGKYLRIRNYRLDMEWELNDTLISLPQRLIEIARRHVFVKTARIEVPEGVDIGEFATASARRIIDTGNPNAID